MRLLVLALVAFGLAAPASAQSRYLAACVASSADEPSIDAAQSEALCACSAENALSPQRGGLTAARLDALIDYTDPEAGYDFDLDGAPEAVQETAIIVVGSLMECLMMQGMEEIAQALMTATGEGEPAAKTEPASGASTGAAAPDVRPRPAARPAGLRTGNGTGTVLTTQQGSGAAIRVVD